MAQQKKNGNFDSFLVFEAILKSALLGVAVGGVAAFLVTLVSWFLDFNGVVLSVILFALVSGGGGYAFYRMVFYPSAAKNARRLDRYGLDERLVTMVELEGDDSYIAERQRQDAMASLSTLDSKRVKLKIPTLILVLSIVFGVLASGMTVVEGLSSAGILPSGTDVWLAIFPPPPPESFRVRYQAGTGGVILGESDQAVIEGSSSETVVAVADEGYMFYTWTDGNTDPSRNDKNVLKDLTFSAVFIEIPPDNSLGDDPGDQPDDVPGEQGMPSPSQMPSDGGSSKYVEINQVIDGKTYYREIYEEYYNKMLEMMENGEEIPDEVREIIESYYNIIK